MSRTKQRSSMIVQPTKPATARNAIVKGLQYLAGVCDYAATRDDVGFNAGDAARGHAMADWSAQAPLTDLELIIAWRMLRKYERTQLKQAGINLPDAETISVLLGPEVDIDTAKDRFEGAIRLGLDDQGNERMIVVFDYSPSKRRRLKQCVASFGGTRFIQNPSGHGGFWTVNPSAVHAVCGEFPDFVRTSEITERLAQPPTVPEQPPHKSETGFTSAADRSTVGSTSMVTAEESPLGTISLEGNHVCVKIERLWNIDRSLAIQFKDTCKAYAQQYGGLGYEPINKYWRINREVAYIVAKTFSIFSQTDAVALLAEAQRKALRHPSNADRDA